MHCPSATEPRVPRAEPILVERQREQPWLIRHSVSVRVGRVFGLPLAHSLISVRPIHMLVSH